MVVRTGFRQAFDNLAACTGEHHIDCTNEPATDKCVATRFAVAWSRCRVALVWHKPLKCSIVVVLFSVHGKD